MDRVSGMTGLKRLREEKKNDHFGSLRYFNRPDGVSCGSRGRDKGWREVVLLGTWRNPLVSFASAPSPLPKTKRH